MKRSLCSEEIVALSDDDSDDDVVIIQDSSSSAKKSKRPSRIQQRVELGAETAFRTIDGICSKLGLVEGSFELEEEFTRLVCGLSKASVTEIGNGVRVMKPTRTDSTHTEFYLRDFYPNLLSCVSRRRRVILTGNKGADLKHFWNYVLAVLLNNSGLQGDQWQGHHSLFSEVRFVFFASHPCIVDLSSGFALQVQTERWDEILSRLAPESVLFIQTSISGTDDCDIYGLHASSRRDNNIFARHSQCRCLLMLHPECIDAAYTPLAPEGAEHDSDDFHILIMPCYKLDELRCIRAHLEATNPPGAATTIDEATLLTRYDLAGGSFSDCFSLYSHRNTSSNFLCGVMDFIQRHRSKCSLLLPELATNCVMCHELTDMTTSDAAFTISTLPDVNTAACHHPQLNFDAEFDPHRLFRVNGYVCPYTAGLGNLGSKLTEFYQRTAFVPCLRSVIDFVKAAHPAIVAEVLGHCSIVAFEKLATPDPVVKTEPTAIKTEDEEANTKHVAKMRVPPTTIRKASKQLGDAAVTINGKLEADFVLAWHTMQADLLHVPKSTGRFPFVDFLIRDGNSNKLKGIICSTDKVIKPDCKEFDELMGLLQMTKANIDGGMFELVIVPRSKDVQTVEIIVPAAIKTVMAWKIAQL